MLQQTCMLLQELNSAFDFQLPNILCPILNFASLPLDAQFHAWVIDTWCGHLRSSGRSEIFPSKQRAGHAANKLLAGVYNLLLLPNALLLFIWSTDADEFELYLWDTFN